MVNRDFLVEIGTEELPPKSLFTLGAALAEGVRSGLTEAAIQFGDSQWYATPRRLAVLVSDVADRQPEQSLKRQGPAVAAAYDSQGAPTKAALGFAASCGVAVDQLKQVDGPKGKVLQFEGIKAGQQTITLLGGIVERALAALPIAKRMRWGSGDAQFVRPVHWILMLFGQDVVNAEVLGLRAGRTTRGHRFHAPGEIEISRPRDYVETLRTRGRVLADAAERREKIASGAKARAAEAGGIAVVEPALLDEVAALVEWPVPFVGTFEERFLKLPPEVPIAVMRDHQRYFPIQNKEGALRNQFVAVANIESLSPDQVREGNERVIRPRLADAVFFWETDLKTPLNARCEQLRTVAYQARLGSLFEKSQRVRQLIAHVGAALGADSASTDRAAQLAKCDLLSLMVGEFPELQGLMGRYYAAHDHEPVEVCAALEEQYLPRFAGDRLPASPTGLALSLAEKLDTIAGIFAIGQKPTGTRDPFGIRRAALGVLRMIIERRLELDLRKLIRQAVTLQPVEAPADTADAVWDYVMERLRAYYLEAESADQISEEMFDAVLANRPASPLDFAARVTALAVFTKLPDAPSLASANKRIVNILRKATGAADAIDSERLVEPSERALYDSLQTAEKSFEPLYRDRNYTEALRALATLRTPVDDFFDRVLVMADDQAIRANRLALLSRLRGLFLRVADLSKLPG
jgi:glycyl-tRNA synthetase beta chain